MPQDIAALKGLMVAGFLKNEVLGGMLAIVAQVQASEVNLVFFRTVAGFGPPETATARRSSTASPTASFATAWVWAPDVQARR